MYVNYTNMYTDNNRSKNGSTKEELVTKKKEKRISTIPCWIFFLSLLEIQLLDADGVHEREEHRKEHKNRCYNRHKTPVVSKMMCYIVTDCLVGLTGDCDDLL
jgi:hypothetical protein